MRHSQAVPYQSLYCLPALAIFLAATGFAMAVTTSPLWAEPKKKPAQCRIEGKVVSCRWLEHCLLEGGRPHKLYGKIICFHPQKKKKPRR